MGSITVTALESVTGIVEIVLPGPQGPVGDIHPSMPGLVQQATDAAASATASALSADTSEANASASATSALASKDAAAVSETTATTKASEASTSATNAAASATTASTKASEASTSATDAAASAAAAATSATDTANALVGERSAVATLTNKTINLTSNTLVATSAQLAAALTDETGTGSAVFATSPALAGTPTAPTAAAGANTTQIATTAHVFAERANAATLTNKTLALGNNTLTGTTAQFNAALTDGDFATLAGAETLTNKTITGGTTNPTTLQEGGVGAVIQSDIGTEPNQIPLNQYLGPLAYRDENPAGAIVGASEVQVLSGKSFSDNVGIGTSSPDARLTVEGAAANLRNSAGTFTLNLTGASIVEERLATSGAGYGDWRLQTGNDSSGLSGSLRIYDVKAAAERLRIDASGNLGIGASSPAYKLDVLGNARIQQSSYADAILRIAQGPLTTGNTSQILFQDQETNTTASISAFGTAFGSGLNGALRIGTVGGAAILDASGNLGLGVTPSAWNAGYKAFQIGPIGSVSGTNSAAYIGQNWYQDAAGQNRYITTGIAASFGSDATGAHIWYKAPSGTAGDPISFTQAMTLSASGNLGLGVVPSAWSTLNAIDVSSWASFAGFTNQAGVLGNTYFDGSNYRYKTTAVATRYEQNSLGTHAWYTAPSGTAGNVISFTQAMTLDASGHLLIGATSSDGAGSSRAQIGNASAATTGLLLKSNTSSASLYASSTSSSYLSWKTGTFMALGTAPDNLGSFSEAARITSEGYLRMAAGSGGIQFNGDTAAANALDDYEEGTFTPTIVGTTTAGVGTYTTQVGRYTKVGNRVFFTCRISMSAHDGAGNMSITGLPFTSNATSGSENPSYFGFAINLALSAGSIPIASVGPNSTQITLRQLPTGGGTNDAIPLDTAADLSIGGHYDV